MRPHLIVPTERNLRFHRRLAQIALASAMLGIVAVTWASAVGPNGSGVALAGFVVSAILVVWRVRRVADRLQSQVRQLASYGQPFGAERVTVEKMQRGSATHFHVVVARFRARDGIEREAVSETFDYDPRPLIDPGVVDVIADPHEPALCVVGNATLPPRRRRQLTREQQATMAPPAAWQAHATRAAWVALVAMLAWTAVLTWKIFA